MPFILPICLLNYLSTQLLSIYIHIYIYVYLSICQSISRNKAGFDFAGVGFSRLSLDSLFLWAPILGLDRHGRGDPVLPEPLENIVRQHAELLQRHESA